MDLDESAKILMATEMGTPSYMQNDTESLIQQEMMGMGRLGGGMEPGMSSRHYEGMDTGLHTSIYDDPSSRYDSLGTGGYMFGGRGPSIPYEPPPPRIHREERGPALFKNLPSGEMLEKIASSKYLSERLGGPSFAQVELFFKSSARYDIAWSTLKVAGAHLQGEKDQDMMRRVIRLAHEYQKGKESLKSTNQEQLLNKLREMTLKLLGETLGQEKLMLQTRFTAYFLKIIIYQFDQADPSRSAEIHRKMYAIYAGLGNALGKAPSSMHARIKEQALKGLRSLIGEERFEYLWRRVVFLFIFLKENQMKSAHGAAAKSELSDNGYNSIGVLNNVGDRGANEVPRDINALLDKVRSTGRPGSQEDVANPMLATPEAASKEDVPHVPETRSSGRKRKAVVVAESKKAAEQVNSTKKRKASAASKKQPETSEKEKQKEKEKEKHKEKEKEKEEAEASQPAIEKEEDKKTEDATKGESIVPMLEIEEIDNSFLDKKLIKKMVSMVWEQYSLTIDPIVFEILSSTLESHLIEMLMKARELMTIRTLPLAKSEYVQIISEPKKDIAAIYKRDFKAAQVKSNAETEALLEEAKKKTSRSKMDDTTLEKLNQLKQAENNKRIAKESNIATQSALGDGKWAKWGSGSKSAEEANPSSSAPAKKKAKIAPAATEADLIVDHSFKSFLKTFGERNQHKTVGKKDLLSAFERNPKYKGSKWLLQQQMLRK